MKDAERRLAYMKGCQALQRGQVRYPEKRKKLLADYIKVAGWDEETVRELQSAVQTPIQQK
jgi:adenylate cyclase